MDRKDDRKEGEEICLCTFCRRMLHVGEELAQHPVYKLGELHYISLAHASCAPKGWDQEVE